MATKARADREGSSVMHIRLEEPHRSRYNNSMERFGIPQTESLRRLMTFFSDAPPTIQRAILGLPSSPEELPALSRDVAAYLARRAAVDLPIAVVSGELPAPPASPRSSPAPAQGSRR